MRTPKSLVPDERIIYHPELSSCPSCEGPLKMHNYLAWDKIVQTLAHVLSVASRPGRCSDPACPGHAWRLLSAEGQRLALPGSTYSYDVVVRVGWLRQERHCTYAEIQDDLSPPVQISESQVRYLYQQVYLPLLACHERQARPRLAHAAKQHGGLIVAVDGLAPEGGEPQLWFLRELLTGLTLRSGWLSRQDQPTFEAFLAPLPQLGWPILAVLSDKQKGLVPAVATVLPTSRHQFCQSHALRNLAEPLADADSCFKVDLRQAVRSQVGSLIRQEPSSAPSPSGLLTATGLLPYPAPKARVPAPGQPSPPDLGSPEGAGAAEVPAQLLRHTRYLLTLKGRPPFRMAGIEIYQRLHQVAAFSAELLAVRPDSRLAELCQGLQTALSGFTTDFQELQQGATWLREVADLLDPDPEGDLPVTGEAVAKRLRTYLDDLLGQASRSPRLAAFCHHLDQVSRNYWPGLFHCYDLADLPRTNNDLESHFRDTQQRLLRTTGQQGQTRRTLQRTGAWELLPRPTHEDDCLAAFRQISPVQWSQEQQRLRKHLERFRLQTRGTQRLQAQFNRLRQQWLTLSLPATG